MNKILAIIIISSLNTFAFAGKVPVIETIQNWEGNIFVKSGFQYYRLYPEHFSASAVSCVGGRHIENLVKIDDDNYSVCIYHEQGRYVRNIFTRNSAGKLKRVKNIPHELQYTNIGVEVIPSSKDLMLTTGKKLFIYSNKRWTIKTIKNNAIDLIQTTKTIYHRNYIYIAYFKESEPKFVRLNLDTMDVETISFFENKHFIIDKLFVLPNGNLVVTDKVHHITGVSLNAYVLNKQWKVVYTTKDPTISNIVSINNDLFYLKYDGSVNALTQNGKKHKTLPIHKSLGSSDLKIFKDIHIYTKFSNDIVLCNKKKNCKSIKILSNVY